MLIDNNRIKLLNLIYFNIPKRFMHTRRGTGHIPNPLRPPTSVCYPTSTGGLTNNPTALLTQGKGPSETFKQGARGYAAMRGGTYKPKAIPPKIIPSVEANAPVQEVQSDTTGYHKIVVAESCTKKDCATTNCATNTAPPCNQPPEYFQDPLPENKALSEGHTLELAGSATHTIPADKKGYQLDHVDVKGNTNKGPQNIVSETTAVPISHKDFRQNAEYTIYLQEDARTNTILNNMPDTSVLKLQK